MVGTAERSAEELLREFGMFRAAATRLESAYRQLEQRAAAVDFELARANDALARALAERDRVLGALPIGVFRRSEHCTVAVNPAAERLAACLDEPPRPDPLPAPGHACELSATDNAGRTRSLRYRWVPLDAGERLELIEDQTALHELRQEVERLDRLGGLAELSLGIAHELRNPLNGLAGFSSMLRRNPNSPKAPAWVAKIEDGAKRMERIIRDLLAFARPSERDAPVERPLWAWLDEARAELAAAARGSSSDVELEVIGGDLSVRGASGVLGKVLANLVRNAREAGATHVRVAGERHASGTLGIAITDNGPGVAAEIVTRVFDPFVGSKESGSGLGLAFCARAMQAMNGSIRLTATDRGARFELELPG